jgi:hypothetical protein
MEWDEKAFKENPVLQHGMDNSKHLVKSITDLVEDFLKKGVDELIKGGMRTIVIHYVKKHLNQMSPELLRAILFYEYDDVSRIRLDTLDDKYKNRDSFVYCGRDAMYDSLICLFVSRIIGELERRDA